MKKGYRVKAVAGDALDIFGDKILTIDEVSVDAFDEPVIGFYAWWVDRNHFWYAREFIKVD